MVKPILLSFVACIFSLHIQATDLKVDTIKVHNYVCAGVAVQIQFVLSNINVLPASGHSYTVLVTDESSNVVFQEQMPADPIEPFTQQVIATYAEWFVQIAGEYTITAVIDFIHDIDTSNNSLSQMTTAIIPREKATDLFTQQIEGLDGCAPDWSSGFVRMLPLQPGDLLTNEPVIEEVQFSLDIDRYKWLSYYDCDPTARYGKLGYFFITDGIDSTTEVVQSSSPLLINGEPYMTSIIERDTTSDRVLGFPEIRDTLAKASTISEVTSTPPPDPPVTCAILAGGEPNDEKEREAFRSDLEFMERNLLMEQLGVQLDSSQIRFIGNSTTTEICDAIDDVSSGYDKILFYYTGHGNHTVNDSNRYGWVSTNGGFLLHSTLASKLKDTRAEDICVILDACFAGEAISSFQSWFGGVVKNKNITVITASSKDTTALTKRIHTTADGEDIWLGFFSWHFVKCYGDPLADMDNDSMISFPEAFHWVRSVNPMASKGPMNEVMDPQMWICRVEPVRPAPEVTRLSDTDCSVVPNSTPASDDSVSCSVDFNMEEPEFEWVDEEIIDISETRVWSLQLKAQTSFDLDVSFRYNLEFDDLDRADSMRIGLVKQDTATGLWEITPSTLDTEANTVTAMHQTELGRYALALITEPVSSVETTRDGVEMTIAPNPSKDHARIGYYLETASTVDLNLFTNGGQLVRKLLSTRQSAGTHTLSVDTRALAPGVYQCVLTANGVRSSGTLVKLD